MADKLYVKIDGKIVAVNIDGTGGGSGGISRKVLYSTSRASTLAAGTTFEVPEYVLGDNSLEIFLNGVRLSKGVEYAEASTTTVAFTSAIPPTYEITAVSYAGTDAGRADRRKPIGSDCRRHGIQRPAVRARRRQAHRLPRRRQV